MVRWGRGGLNYMQRRFGRGDVVVVKSGRKLRHGLVGRVFWSGWKNYGAGDVERVGLIELGDASETALWTSAYNLRMATPEEVVPDVRLEAYVGPEEAPYLRLEQGREAAREVEEVEVVEVGDGGHLDYRVVPKRKSLVDLAQELAQAEVA